MTKKVLVLLAEGFEDVEAVTPIDYLRRAGAEVFVAAVTDLEVRSARALKLVADTTLGELSGDGDIPDISRWDAVVIPGGMPGASNIASSSTCRELIQAMAASGRLVAAICAAPPLVLFPLGLLKGKKFTCFPGMEGDVVGGHWSLERVVVDGNIITSRAAGTAGEWSLAIVTALFGKEAADKIVKATLLRVHV